MYGSNYCMNGCLLPPRPLSWGSRNAALLRLCAALLASSLLHITLVLLPFLGKSNMAVNSGVRKESGQQQMIQATLRPLAVNVSTDFPLPVPPEPGIALKLDGDTNSADINSSVSMPPQQPSLGADLLPIPALMYYPDSAEVPPTPAPIYYPTELLTKRPQSISFAELDTPNTNPIVASGEITLKLWIDDFGEVTNIEVEKTSMPKVFSTQAIAAFKHLHFTPGERNGQRVGSVMRIVINYIDGRVPPR